MSELLLPNQRSYTRMKYSLYIKWIFASILILVSTWDAHAQIEQDTTDQESLVVKFAERRIADVSGELPEQIYYGDVRLYKDSIFMFCDTARIIGKDLWAKGNVIIIQHDTVKVFADSLFFDGDTTLAYLYNDIVLENGDRKLYTDILIYNTETKTASYQDTAIMTQQNTSLQSVRGYYNVQAEQAFFYDDVYIEGEDMQMRADSMSYMTAEQRAIFMGPTRIKQTHRDIYCESGFYDMDDEMAVFEQNAQYIEPDSEAEAHRISYDKMKGEIKLEGNAYYRNKEDEGSGDVIIYNEIDEQAELIGNARFSNTKNEVEGERIFYDKKTEAFKVSGRSVISDAPYIIAAEDIDYDKATGTAMADGMVEWQDTSAGITIYSDHLRYKEATGSVIATNDSGKPLMRNISGTDTLYLASERLISYDEYITDTLGVVDTVKYLIADNEVQLLRGSIQGICDSLVYKSSDSLFVMMDDPVVWADSSQVIGDTIEVYLRNDDIDRMEVYPDAFMANSPDLIFFNQIAGRRFTSRFLDGELHTMDVIGNAQSLYYMTDDEEAYIGVNKTECSRIRFTFADKQIANIKSYKQPKSQLLPIKGTDHNELRLERFVWRYDERPISIDDLQTNLTIQKK